jgi:membrane-bound lytic murein transglycosylase D
MKLTAAFFICMSSMALAQSPQVPHKMQFGGITLTIRDDARREIQHDVDMLTRSPKHLALKADRAKTYFPIIEKIFEEERVPDDFKYLVLQESALISDAVSVSNAVGFWQFKDFTAMEMGLRVDGEIDERMNIVSSSRAAAKYFKKNNYYFNNWLYALQAYQMGAGGVLQSVKDVESGAKHMEITSKTYWYVKKFLAHKVAYEDIVKGVGSIKIIPLVNQDKKRISDVAQQFVVSEDDLRAYNKWIRADVIPGDRTYTIAIPTAGDDKALNEAIALASKKQPVPVVARVDAKPANALNETIHLNGILAMKARAGENITALVKRADADLSDFLRFNDLSISDKLTAGDFYYLQKKKSKAQTAYHIIQKGENLWSVSQKYGVQLRKLQKYNRVDGSSVPEGLIVYLSGKKPSDSERKIVDVAEVDTDNSFNWAIEPESVLSSTKDTPVTVLPEVKKQEPPQDSTATTETISVNANDHVVQPGETLYSIARLSNLGVMDLVRWNNLKLEEGIKPGQVLSLKPSVADTPKVNTGIVHQVKPSDTLYSVAREYGVTIKEIMDWNQKKDFSLSVGENLRILKRQ